MPMTICSTVGCVLPSGHVQYGVDHTPPLEQNAQSLAKLINLRFDELERHMDNLVNPAGEHDPEVEQQIVRPAGGDQPALVAPVGSDPDQVQAELDARDAAAAEVAAQADEPEAEEESTEQQGQDAADPAAGSDQTETGAPSGDSDPGTASV